MVAGRSIAKQRPVCYPHDTTTVATRESPARKRQGELGQFLTPAPIAGFMASLFGPLPQSVRLLDAGAGAGALTSAFISRLCDRNHGVRTVEATLYEMDPRIQAALADTLEECQQRCDRAGIHFRFTIHSSDCFQQQR